MTTTAGAATTATTSTRPGIANAVDLTGLTKTFGEVRAVRGIDLAIVPGEVVAFLGPNGAGKTTTIDMILAIAEPTTGTVEVLGLSPQDAVRHGLVSAVMQTGGLLKDLSVRETIDYTASLFPLARPTAEVLQMAGLTELGDRLVGKCSGGEQQRVRLAMALVCDPQLLILDEPTTGVDVNARRAFWSSIHTEAAKGRTILFATHYLEETDLYADRVVLVRKGRIVADGTSAEIKALGAGRSVRATWPGVTPEDVNTLPGVDGVDMIGDTVTIHSGDSDAIARHLLTHTPARDLEITARGLEDAVVVLTADDTDEEK